MITNSGHSVFRSRTEAVSALFGGNFYMALSSDNTALAAGDTTLPGELTGNGLARAVCTFAHTTGQQTWTATVTFTYTGSTTTAVNKVALFDAASGGNLICEYLLTSATTFSTSGDNVQYSITFTL